MVLNLASCIILNGYAFQPTPTLISSHNFLASVKLKMNVESIQLEESSYLIDTDFARVNES